MMTLKAILAGVGRRGKWALDVIGGDPRFMAVAVVDTNPDFLREAQLALGLPDHALFADLSAALKQTECDVVVACTPTATHAPLARLAFAAKKHFLVEKGMTMNWHEANTLVREAHEAGVKFCVAQNYRYHPVESAVTEVLGDPAHEHNPGRLGIVDMIQHRYRPDPRTLNYPYAMVWDMSCHHMDLLNAWLGEAVRVTAVSSNPYWSGYEHDADIAAVIEYQGNVICHYVLTHAATITTNRLILQGDRGALRGYDIAGLQFYPKPLAQLESSDPIECKIASQPPSEQRVVDAFYHYIVDGIEPGISGRNNLRTMAACEMLVRSARDRRSVEASELM